MSTLTAGQKLRAAISANQPLQIVGTINAYTAMMAERTGHVDRAIAALKRAIAKAGDNTDFLRLQLAHAGGEGIDLALGLAADLVGFGLLVAHVGAHGRGNREAGAATQDDAGTQQDRNGQQRPARALVGHLVQEPGEWSVRLV